MVSEIDLAFTPAHELRSLNHGHSRVPKPRIPISDR